MSVSIDLEKRMTYNKRICTVVLKGKNAKMSNTSFGELLVKYSTI